MNCLVTRESLNGGIMYWFLRQAWYIDFLQGTTTLACIILVSCLLAPNWAGCIALVSCLLAPNWAGYWITIGEKSL